jgi:hypothetical protein
LELIIAKHSQKYIGADGLSVKGGLVHAIPNLPWKDKGLANRLLEKCIYTKFQICKSITKLALEKGEKK